MTRHRAIEPVEDSVATPAGAGPAANRQVRRASGREPLRGLNLPLVAVSPDPASSRSGHGPRAATHEDTLLRLALWLAEVAAEATLATTAPAK